MKKKLIIATGNVGKAREFAALFPAYEVLSMKEAGFTGAIEETGDTFYENALIKARAVSDALGTDALADDSGNFSPRWKRSPTGGQSSCARSSSAARTAKSSRRKGRRKGKCSARPAERRASATIRSFIRMI